MGRTRNTKANNSALDKTPTNLPNSQETGHSSEPEKTRPTTTPTPTTRFSTAGIEELKSGDVASVLTGATDTQSPPDPLKTTPPFAMAGNQDALQLSGTTPVFAVGMQEGGGGRTIRGRFTCSRTTLHPHPLRRIDVGYNYFAGQATRRIRSAEYG